MNIIDIVKNAPEGAERYKVFEDGFIEYYALIDGVKKFYSNAEKKFKEQNLENFKDSLPLPKLKTEWVKVEDSIFELGQELQAGDLYFDFDGDESNKQPIKTESELVFLRSLHHPIYRKVEKVSDEKQEYLDEFDRVFKLWHSADTYTRAGSLAEFFYGHGFSFNKPD